MNPDIPKDPMILFGFINLKLRDYYESLDALCNDLDINKDELIETLEAAGFEYNVAANKFW